MTARAIRTVAALGKDTNGKFPRICGSAIFSEQAWAAMGRSLKLSGRELQIARAVFDDRTEFAIAAELGMSPHTVHTHLKRLHRKLGVVDRVQLILRMVEEFLALTAAPDSILPSLCANQTAGRCPLRPNQA